MFYFSSRCFSKLTRMSPLS